MIIDNLTMIRRKYTACEIFAKNGGDLETELKKSVDTTIANT